MKSAQVLALEKAMRRERLKRQTAMTKERVKVIAARRVIRHPESKPSQILRALEYLEKRDTEQAKPQSEAAKLAEELSV